MKLTTTQKLGIGAVATVILGGTGLIIYNKKKDKVKVIKDIKNYDKSTVGTVNIVETAKKLGMDMGYAYPSYDPRRWTENDTAVFNTIAQFPKALMKALVDAYAKEYSRNLQADVQKLLPATDYLNIRDKFI